MPYLRNLCSSEVFDDQAPWEFTDLAKVPSECIIDKAARDRWVNTPTTNFHVYSLFEGVQKNLRLRGDKVGEDNNPPFSMSGLAVDYDAPLTGEHVKNALKLMGEHWPTWYEKTLSGNARLLWLFEEPIRLPSLSFTRYMLEKIGGLIPIDKLPGLDKPALLNPTRYFTNGCIWTKLSDHKIPGPLLQGFVMRLAEKFNWRSREFGKVISLVAVEAECRKRYPRFNEWPGELTLGAQGPTFWIDGSESPKSAIVRDTGIHTFSAHATKAFYSWAEIVGAEFVQNAELNAMGEAVAGIVYDGKNFVFKDSAGKFIFETKDNLRMILATEHGLRATKMKGEESTEVDRALSHCILRQRVDGATSCAFYPHGIFNYNGKRILNTHQIEAMRPFPETGPWGPEGKFPFLSQFFDTFFHPVHPQKERFLAWFQHFYRACLNREPRSGHGLFVCGPVGVGKTFLNRGIIGRSVGGFALAHKYLTGNQDFNSELFDSAFWVIDDGSISTNESLHRLYSENIKNAVANRDHQVNEKYRKAVTTPWQGRIGTTCNDDPESIRQIPNLDISIREKLMIFRAAKEATVKFFEQSEMEKLLDRELPFFLRWLLDWQPVAHCFEGSEVRFGIASYCEPSLSRISNQSSSANAFAELLQKWLIGFFTEEHPSATLWQGTATDLRVAMSSNEIFADMLRPYRPERFGQMLVQLQLKRIFEIEISDEGEQRIFRIIRDARFRKPKAAPVAAIAASKFAK